MFGSPAKAERWERHEARIRGAGTKPVVGTIAISFEAFRKRENEGKSEIVPKESSRKKQKTGLSRSDAATTTNPPVQQSDPQHIDRPSNRRAHPTGNEAPMRPLPVAPNVSKERSKARAAPEAKPNVTDTIVRQVAKPAYASDSLEAEPEKSERRDPEKRARRKAIVQQDKPVSRSVSDLPPVERDNAKIKARKFANGPRPQATSIATKVSTSTLPSPVADKPVSRRQTRPVAEETIETPIPDPSPGKKASKPPKTKRPAAKNSRNEQPLSERNANLPSPKKPTVRAKEKTTPDDDLDWLFDITDSHPATAPLTKLAKIKPSTKKGTAGKGESNRPSKPTRKVEEMDLDDLVSNIALFAPTRLKT